MLKLGQYQTLAIARDMHQGLYLEDEDRNEVLMPWTYAPDHWEIGEELEVLVYTDSEGRVLATNEEALILAGGVASLMVTDVNEIGAFCDWGTSNELLIPFSNQVMRLEPGRRVIVHMYVDELTNRLVGSTNMERSMKREADGRLSTGQKVALIVYGRTDLGYKVVINGEYVGLIYLDEHSAPLRLGQQTEGYIKPIREDGKIDVSLQPVGAQSIEPNAQMLLEHLERNAGFLPFTDKSDPEKIRKAFGISKKLFKKALGSLYRQKLVELREDGIHQL